MRRRVRFGITLIASFALLGAARAEDPVPIGKTWAGPYGPVTAPKAGVIQDTVKWNEFWKKSFPHHPRVPEVDFSKHAVVYAFAGQRPSGGYGLVIEEVKAADGAVLYRIVESRPGQAGGGFSPAVETFPYTFKVVTRPAGKISIEPEKYNKR